MNGSADVEMNIVTPHPQANAAITADEDLPGNVKIAGARNSVQMMKDDIPITAMELEMGKNSHVPAPIQKYANFVSEQPRICLFISVIFMLGMSAIGFIVRDDLPDFAKADKGFDARGTDLAAALRTVTHFDAETYKFDDNGISDDLVCNGALTYNLDGSPMVTSNWWGCTNAEDDERRRMAATSRDDVMDEEREALRALYEQHQVEGQTCSYAHSWLFEGSPTWPPMQVVFEAQGDDLLDVDTLKAICAFDDDIRSKYGLAASAETNWATGEPCEDRNLGDYVGYYYHKTCAEITATDVENFRTLLTTCQPAFTAGSLVLCSDEWVPNGCIENAVNNTSPAVPKECFRENIVYDVLANIVDKDFKTTNKVKYTKVIGAYTWENELTPVHTDLESDLDKSYGSAKIAGYRLGDKFDVFTDQLIIDNVFSGGAFFLVFCIMWLHTSSGFIASLGFLQIILNLGVAYGIYMAVMNLPFFPFLNLVGIFVVVGIGADDVFVFMDCWKQSILVFGEGGTLADRMGYVLYRAGGSMLITSLTTASAFCANALSLITSLKCFGVYCALVVVVDYFLMLSYVPALVIIYEKYVRKSPLCCRCCTCCTFCHIPKDPTQLRPLEAWFRDKFGPFVVKFKYPLALAFVALAAGLGFNASGLERPTSADFQLFKATHPMEMYDLQLKYKFNGASDSGTLKLTFVFGVEALDNGNHWDPDDYGKLTYVDMDFDDLLTPTNQAALEGWCDHFRSSSFYKDPCVEDPDDRFCRFQDICQFEWVKAYVTTDCADTTNDFSAILDACSGDDCLEAVGKIGARTTCCGLAFPMTDASIARNCTESVFQLASSDDLLGDRNNGNMGLIFDTATKDLKIFLMQLDTNIEYQETYEVFETFYNDANADMKVAKASLEGTFASKVFYQTRMDFFDLQMSLGIGAYQSAGMSFAFAFAVLMFMTRNPILTLLSLLTIIAIVCCVIGVLVFDNWELNIMESVIISVAVGMAVDFVAHYSHTYLHSPVKDDREIAVLNTLKTMGGSVLTGAITTFVAGGFMVFANTLFFYQFGFFMMMTMIFAWSYSNFLLLPLIAIMGPVKAKKDSAVREKVIQVEE